MSISRWRLVVLIGLAALAAATPAVADDGILHLFAEILVMTALSALWNLLAGYGGLMSLGQQAFIGIGGYTVYVLANELEVPPYYTVVAAPILCAVCAAFSTVFLFRLREAYFAIGTWVVAEVLTLIAAKSDFLGAISGVTLQTLPMINFDWFETVIFWASSALCLGVIAGSFLFLRSRVGLALMSVRDNELAATSVGVNVWRNRFIAFVIVGAGCGLAGGIQLLSALTLAPTTAFSLDFMIAMIFIVVVGGIGTLEGPILGSTIYFTLREALTNLLGLSGTWYLVAMGTVAVATMLWAPKGLWPMLRDRFGWDWLGVTRRLPERLQPKAKV